MPLSLELQADAEHVLDEEGYPWTRVLDVDVDCILYENKLHKARTVWLHRHKGTGRLRVQMVEGFQIWPPDGFHGQPWPPESYHQN